MPLPVIVLAFIMFCVVAPIMLIFAIRFIYKMERIPKDHFHSSFDQIETNIQSQLKSESYAVRSSGNHSSISV